MKSNIIWGLVAMKDNSTDEMNRNKVKAMDQDESVSVAESHFESLAVPFQHFIASQKTSSVLLIVCTCAALMIVNFGFLHQYELFLTTPIGIHWGDQTLTLSLHH